MKEYIEREIVLAITEDFLIANKNKLDYSPNKAPIYHMLKTLTAADVKPVIHGKWIPNWGGPFLLGNYCSLCNNYEEITIKHSEGSNYCSNCGAKMDGGKR